MKIMAKNRQKMTYLKKHSMRNIEVLFMEKTVVAVLHKSLLFVNLSENCLDSLFVRSDFKIRKLFLKFIGFKNIVIFVSW